MFLANSTMSKKPIPLIADPFFDDVVLLLEFDGADADTSTVDASSLNQTITFVGNADIDRDLLKIGHSSLRTDNTPEGDYVTVPAVTLGTSDFTVECYVHTYDIKTGTNNNVFYDQRTSETSQVRPAFYFNGFNGLFWFVNGVNELEAANSIFQDTWYHVAVSRTGTTTRLFVDGTEADSFTDTHNYLSNTLRVGADIVPNQGLQGWVDNMRVTVGTGRYTANFTAPTQPHPTIGLPATTDPDFSSVVLLLAFDGTDAATSTTDSSSSGHTITFVNSSQLDTAQMKFGTASLLNAVSTEDHLLANDSNDWNFAAGDFTVESHVRFANLPGSGEDQHVISHYEPNGGDRSWVFGFSDLAGQLRIRALHNITGGGGAANQLDDVDISLSADTWYHCAWCRNGADFRMFIDGVQQGSTFNWATDSLYNSTHELTIAALGRGAPGPTWWIDGWIDNLRVTKGVARYTANFTPPTAAYLTS